jgi:hypothetical protein
MPISVNHKIFGVTLSLGLALLSIPAAFSQPNDSVVPQAYKSTNDVRLAAMQQGHRTFTVGMSLRELESLAGTWPEPLKDWAQYPSGLTVILRDDQVIHLSCVPSPQALSSSEPWQVMGIQLGTSEAQLRSQLGISDSLLARREAGLTCWIYSTKIPGAGRGNGTAKGSGDVGFILGSSHRVEAMMMVEQGKLQTILLTRGYSIL